MTYAAGETPFGIQPPLKRGIHRGLWPLDDPERWSITAQLSRPYASLRVRGSPRATSAGPRAARSRRDGARDSLAVGLPPVCKKGGAEAGGCPAFRPGPPVTSRWLSLLDQIPHVQLRNREANDID